MVVPFLVVSRPSTPNTPSVRARLRSPGGTLVPMTLSRGSEPIGTSGSSEIQSRSRLRQARELVAESRLLVGGEKYVDVGVEQAGVHVVGELFENVGERGERVRLHRGTVWAAA